MNLFVKNSFAHRRKRSFLEFPKTRLHDVCCLSFICTLLFFRYQDRKRTNIMAASPTMCTYRSTTGQSSKACRKSPDLCDTQSSCVGVPKCPKHISCFVHHTTQTREISVIRLQVFYPHRYLFKTKLLSNVTENSNRWEGFEPSFLYNKTSGIFNLQRQLALRQKEAFRALMNKIPRFTNCRLGEGSKAPLSWKFTTAMAALPFHRADGSWVHKMRLT